MVSHLKQVTEIRKALSESINIQDLWEILHDDPQEIDISAMTLFCFDPPLTPDHEAAVIRAFFNDRLYFKFNKVIFLPFTEAQVEAKRRQIREEERRKALITNGAAWLVQLRDQDDVGAAPDPALLKILKDYYIFGNDADKAFLSREIIKKAGLSSVDRLFELFVRITSYNVCYTKLLRTVENGIGMGIATTFVLVFSNILVSMLRNIIPSKVRIACYIVIVATFVTIVEFIMQAYTYELFLKLGIFIPLIVVNCIVLGRAEAFAGKNTMLPSAADGLGMGIGFTMSLASLGAVRELIGAGTLTVWGGSPRITSYNVCYTKLLR